MSGAVRIRDAHDDDRAEMRALTLHAYAEFADRMTPSAWAGLEQAVHAGLDGDLPGVQRIVAERDGRVVGSVMLYPAADSESGRIAGSAGWPELRLLAVLPEARGVGVGQALVEACVRRARAAGFSNLGLHTSASLAVARRMYGRMGFERVPEHDFQPFGGELVEAYRLRITPAVPDEELDAR